MAAKNTETSSYIIGSQSTSSGIQQGIRRVNGTAVTTGGSTSVVIIPGYDANTGDSLLTEGSLNLCRGIKKILGFGVTNTANSNAFKAVKSTDGTALAEKITITCTANDTFQYWIEGADAGQNV